MDEIDKRLRDAADNCIKAYEGWSKSRKNVEMRETLQDAVHELRKVSARLEIELASSERDESQRQIPIPAHRSQRRRPDSSSENQDFHENDSPDDAIGNNVEGSEGGSSNRPGPRQNGPHRMQRRPMRPRPQPEGNE